VSALHSYLDGTDLERDCEALMQFRLTYNGSLKATQGTPGPMHTDKRAAHKHEIRREFHHQLKHFWATNRFLSTATMAPGTHSPVLPLNASMIWPESPNTQRPMVHILGDLYGHSGYRFVPLVRKEIKLACSLRVLFLRRDFPASVLSAGDIDNRLKTLVDALRMPLATEGVPRPPMDDEDPFFVLLDDDRQVTHLEVETDAALAPEKLGDTDVSFARLIVTVDVRPYDVNMFNLNFA
jgi:hypothetical protein